MARKEEQRALLMARRRRHPVASLGKYLPDVEATLAAGCRAARVHLGSSPEAGILGLIRQMS